MVSVTALITAQIINVVLDYANYSDYVLREIDDNYIQPMLSLKYTKIVNVILNKALPGMDTIENRVRGGYAHNGGEVITLPTSVIVQYLTAGLKPVVLYQPRGGHWQASGRPSTPGRNPGKAGKGRANGGTSANQPPLLNLLNTQLDEQPNRELPKVD